MQKKRHYSSCTTILVGKKATFDGSTMMARDEDIYEDFNPKRHIIILPQNQPKKYKSSTGDFELILPSNPLQYSSKPDAREGSGIFGEAGTNSLNISMTATETITTNALVLGADPFVDTGIGEEDLLTIILPYIKTAREGVFRLEALLEKYGTYESNGIGFQDENEIWWVETIGGHHYIAKRVADDEYCVCPNYFNINSFDFVDAYGEQKNNICSKDLLDFIKKNNLNLTNIKDLSKEKNFNTRLIFGSHTDIDKYYNSPRAWFMLRYFNKTQYDFDNEDSLFNSESDNLPWSLKPEHKITIDDIKYVLSSHYQGTKYDPFVKYGDLTFRNKYRTIGYNKNGELTLSHIRPNLPEKIKCIEWIAFGPNVFNVFIPQYSRVNNPNKYLENYTEEVNTNNFYWITRLNAALADQNFDEAKPLVEKYQNLIGCKNMEFINKFDKKFKEKNTIDENELEEANDIIVKFVKKELNKLLNELLFVSSLKMKNAYSRSDA